MIENTGISWEFSKSVLCHSKTNFWSEMCLVSVILLKVYRLLQVLCYVRVGFRSKKSLGFQTLLAN